MLFLDIQVGSLEAGKFADFIVIDTDHPHLPGGEDRRDEGVADVFGWEADFQPALIVFDGAVIQLAEQEVRVVRSTPGYAPSPLARIRSCLMSP